MIKNCLLALLSTMAFCLLNSLSFANVTVTLLAFIILFFFYQNVKAETDRYSELCALVLALFLGFGKFLVFLAETGGYLLWVKVLFSVAGSFLFFRRAIAAAFGWLMNFKVQKTAFSSKLFIISFLIIFVCWLPYWFTHYPGNYPPDTINQLYQNFGIYSYSNANPLLHTLLIKASYNFFALFTTDINQIMAFSGLLQMVINAAIYALVVTYVYSESGNKIMAAATIAFYGLLSYNAVYNTSVSKDAMFTSITVLLLLMIVKWYKKPSLLNSIILTLSGIAYCLLRANGYYALAIVIVCALLVGCYKYQRKLLNVLLVIFTLASLIRYPVYTLYLNKANGRSLLVVEAEEPLSEEAEEPIIYKHYFRGSFLYVMAFQQVANVVYHERELNEKEEWLIEEHAPLEVIREVYNPILVDPLFEWVTYYTTPERQNISNVEYLKLWLELFIKYPNDYFEAYFNMTRYYFYPNRYVKPYYEGIYNNELGIHEESLTSIETKEMLDTFYNNQAKIPFVSSLLCPGVTTCLMMAALIFVLKAKKRVSFVALSFLFANFFILMACVPLNDEFRYIYPIVGALPFILMQFLTADQEG